MKEKSMKNLEELKEIRDRVRKDLELRAGKHRIKIIICLGTCGIAAGARQTMNTLIDLIAQKMCAENNISIDKAKELIKIYAKK